MKVEEDTVKKNDYRHLAELLEQANVIVKGHTELSSGLHSDVYYEKFRIVRNPLLMQEAAATMALWIQQHVREDIHVIVSPEKGGAYFGLFVAYLLTRYRFGEIEWNDDRAIHFLNAEKMHEKFEFRNGIEPHIAGQHCFLIDDVITTGTTLSRLSDLVHRRFGTVLGALTLYDRGLDKRRVSHLGRLGSLIRAQAKHWTEDECPLCEDPQETTAIRRSYSGDRVPASRRYDTNIDDLSHHPPPSSR